MFPPPPTLGSKEHTVVRCWKGFRDHMAQSAHFTDGETEVQRTGRFLERTGPRIGALNSPLSQTAAYLLQAEAEGRGQRAVVVMCVSGANRRPWAVQAPRRLHYCRAKRTCTPFCPCPRCLGHVSATLSGGSAVLLRGQRMLRRWEERDPSLPLSWKIPDHFLKDRGTQKEKAWGSA